MGKGTEALCREIHSILEHELIVGRPNTWLGRWAIVYGELDGAIMPDGVKEFKKNKGKIGEVVGQAGGRKDHPGCSDARLDGARLRFELPPCHAGRNAIHDVRAKPKGHPDNDFSGQKHSLEVTTHIDDAEWNRLISVNLTGVFYCMREVLKVMEPRRYGKIINISSIAG